VATGVTISTGTGNFTTLQAETVILNGTAKIEGLYSDSLGDRILVTNLDPQGFGVSWNIRYKVIGETIWTELSGTGNTALILAETGEYRMQARVAGYTWKEIEFDTSISLAVDLSLQYHVADDGSPQYLKPYNATLVDAFEYNDAAMEVEVTNTTGSIVQPGFPELYQVVEKVQQDPTLVWFWVNPVTTNATSQKVLIPPTSPLRMYLSADSTASVKITCPVVYSDTGISADDRVKGNPSGFSIILGSSATADSSLIVSQLVEQLGGSGYVTNQNSLKKISDKAESLQNYDDTALKAKVDATLKAADYVAPDNTKIDQIKTKVDTLENYDDAALTAKVDATLKAVDYVTPDNTKIAQIKTKVDTLENYDDTELTAKVDATLKAVDYVAPDNAKIAQIKSIVEDKTGYSLTSAQVEAIAVAVESHLLDEGDGQMLLNAIAQAIGNENIDQIALVAAIRADMERSGGKITQIQTKVDTLQNYNDTALTAKVDATLKAADYVIPDNDTVTIINTKLDELAGDEYDPATDSIKKIKDGLTVVNNGVKKASLEIPHTESI
jgi:osmotically-inducible protein OsmY